MGAGDITIWRVGRKVRMGEMSCRQCGDSIETIAQSSMNLNPQRIELPRGAAWRASELRGEGLCKFTPHTMRIPSVTVMSS
jgi:hypothetical protein